MGGDEGTYVEAQLLIMERNGYPEETYYTFSYSPIPERRRHGRRDHLRQQRRYPARDRRAAARAAARISRRRPATRATGAMPASAARWRSRPNPRDLPFALIYVAEPDGCTAVLAGASGIERGHAGGAGDDRARRRSPWPIGEVLSSQNVATSCRTCRGAGERGIPTGPWPHPPTQAAPDCHSADRRHRPRRRPGRRPQSVPPVRRQLPRLPRSRRRPDRGGDRQRRRPMRRSAGAPRRWRSSTAPRRPSSPTSATSSARR